MALEVTFKARGNRLKESGYSREQEGEIYDNNLTDLYNNPRWYLDNLTYLAEYRLRWTQHSKTSPTLPLKYVKSRKVYKETITSL